MGGFEIKIRGKGKASGGPGARIGASLFFALFFGMGAFFVVMLTRTLAADLDTWSWRASTCWIDASSVERRSGDEPYHPVVRFHETSSGTRGSDLRPRASSYDSYGRALEDIAPYPAGAAAPCLASTSGQLVLERGSLAFAAWLLLPLTFAAIGLFGLIETWRPARNDRLGRPAVESISQKASGLRAGKAMIGVGFLLSAIAAPLLWFMTILPAAGMATARSWTPSTCSIEHASVRTHSSDDGTTWSVDVFYRWPRDGAVERSSRYSFFNLSGTAGRNAKVAAVRRFPAGSEQPCWVHPTLRNEAVLERGLTDDAWTALIPLVFALSGPALIVGGRRRTRRRGRLQEQAARGMVPFAPGDAVLEALPNFEWVAGPELLVSRTSRWGRFGAAVVGAVLWNGATAFLVMQVLGDFERGRGSWGMALFALPFVLAGLAVLAAVVYGALALANARPRLLLEQRVLQLGDELRLHWQMRGRTAPLERVRIVLRAREEATYTVGTDTHTATQEVYEHVLVDVPPPACGLGGDAQCTIPDTAVHSFEAPRNKIVWELEFRGEIRRWPDVRECYAIVVLPHGKGRHKATSAEREGEG